MIDPGRICMRCMAQLNETKGVCPNCGFDNAHIQTPSHQLDCGTILAGAYLVGCALGQGGFGITYVGWDLNLDVKVAIKEYYPEGCVSRDSHSHATVLTSEGSRGDFFRSGKLKFVEEAKVLARFSGDGCIVNVRNFFNENGTAYIVMDFVDGMTLKTYVSRRGGKLPSRELLTMLRPLMYSLKRVHDAGMLHRDISPDNIMVRPDGTVKLLDFGAARQISAYGERSNTINVKHGFAPEEQYRKRGEQGPWTDVYALCATIYRLTTGSTPPQALDRMMGDDELTPPNQLGADFTNAQEQAILQGLAVRHDMRLQSVGELIDALYSERALAAGGDDEATKTARTNSEREKEQEWARGEADRQAQSLEREQRTEYRKQLIKRKLAMLLERVKAHKKTAILAGGGLIVCVLAIALLVNGKPKEKTNAAKPVGAAVSTTDTDTEEGSITFDLPEMGGGLDSLAEPQAEERTVDGMKYLFYDNGEVAFNGYAGVCPAAVTIPSSVEGKAVTQIAESAFSYEPITSVSIPSSIRVIGADAFQGTALTKVTIPSTVERVGEFAFGWCETLTEVTIENGVLTLENGAFRGCKLLASADIPASVRVIGGGIFQYCADGFRLRLDEGNTAFVIENSVLYSSDKSKLIWFFQSNPSGSFRVPDSVKEIGNGAFGGVTGLSGITMPSGLTTIDSEAFYGTQGLATITIPASVTTIGEQAFAMCWDTERIVVETGNENYVSKDGSLYTANMETLLQYPVEKGNASFTMPSTVREIGSHALYFCSDLTSITLSDALESIGNSAFGYTSITQITLPDGLKTIGSSAFSGCSELESVIVPDSVTTIGMYAFSYCDGLKYAELGAGVETVDICAFSYDDALTNVVVNGAETAFERDAFLQSMNVTLQAPAGSKAQKFATENGVQFIVSEQTASVEPKVEALVWSDQYTDDSMGLAATASFDGKTLTILLNDVNLKATYTTEYAGLDVGDGEHAWVVNLVNGVERLTIGLFHLNTGGDTTTVAPEDMQLHAVYAATEDSAALLQPSVARTGNTLVFTLDMSNCGFPFDGAKIEAALTTHVD